MHFLAVLLIVMTGGVAQAQTPPSASELKLYEGLHRAAHEGNLAAVRNLISKRVDLDARDRSGRTPAHVAAFASNDDVLRALAAAGADMNALESRFYDVLTIAAVANDPGLVSTALELGNRADLVTSVYDGTALIAAAHLGHYEVVSRLIEGGRPCRSRSGQGHSRPRRRDTASPRRGARIHRNCGDHPLSDCELKQVTTRRAAWRARAVSDLA
jgi:ankyrin repeat protein